MISTAGLGRFFSVSRFTRLRQHADSCRYPSTTEADDERFSQAGPIPTATNRRRVEVRGCPPAGGLKDGERRQNLHFDVGRSN